VSDDVQMSASAVTVEYDSVGRQDAILVRPFPHVDDAPVFRLVGALHDLRGVVDTMARMLDDLESEGS
jgi:hypothetical protein